MTDPLIKIAGIWAASVLLSMAALSQCNGCAPYAEQEGGPIMISPEPALHEATEIWVARWSAVTGVEMIVGVGGIPVVVANDVLDDDGTPLCGATRRAVQGSRELGVMVEIDLTPPEGCSSSTLGHELGHALGGHGHTERGLMAPKLDPSREWTIDSDALELVCAGLGCRWMAPESSRLGSVHLSAQPEQINIQCFYCRQSRDYGNVRG